ncbi:hypothetical protein WN943_003926 [Citrus x changshan-huyou]
MSDWHTGKGTEMNGKSKRNEMKKGKERRRDRNSIDARLGAGVEDFGDRSLLIRDIILQSAPLGK